MTTSEPKRQASARGCLFPALAVMACLLLLAVILATQLDPSGSTQQAEPAADPPSAAVDETVVDETVVDETVVDETVVDETAVQRCGATALVDAAVTMQPEERGDDGTRTLGTLTISTASTEPLRVWILVDVGEIGATDWSREGWESTGPPLTSGAAVEERLSQTVYDDGDSTWRINNAVAAWRTTADCAELPTDAQLDAVATPL